MDKKILAIGEPIVKFNQDYAFLTSTMCSDPSFNNWLMNNAIQIYSSPQNRGCNLTFFYLGSESNPINNIPLFDHQIVKMDFLKQSSLTLTEFTELMIESDYYVTNTLDEFFLKNRFSFQKEHFEHGILIYGYDSLAKQIFTAGYDNSAHFQRSSISYEDYNLAFESTTRNSRISCFKRNSKQYKLDPQLVKQLLGEFINSKNTSLHYRALQEPLVNCYWGIDAFTQLTDSTDIRCFFFLYEYIMLMGKRAKCFGLYDLEERFKKLSEQATIILNITLKSIFKKDPTNSRLLRLNTLIQCLMELLIEFYEEI